jgi:hypothetical protein
MVTPLAHHDSGAAQICPAAPLLPLDQPAVISTRRGLACSAFDRQDTVVRVILTVYRVTHLGQHLRPLVST